MKKLFPLLVLVALPVMGQGTGSRFGVENMDTKVKPGTDFYRYASGKWIDSHPLTAEYTRYGQFNELAEENNRQVRELIEELAATPNADGSLEQKIGSLYRLAMDSVRRNEEGFGPIVSTLQKIENIKTLREYIITTAWLVRRGVPAMMFIMGFDADMKNAEENIAQIYQGGISMRERDYYLSDEPATVKIRNAYREYVKKLFMMVGNNEAEAALKRDAVLDIETRIAKASYSRTQLRDVEGNYHKMSYVELQEAYSGIDWSTCFLHLGFPAVEAVCVGQPEPIHEVEKILTETPIEKLKAYAEFKVIDNAASALSDEFRAAKFDFYNHTMSGAEQDRPRWKRAVEVVQDVLGMAVGKMYVERYFPAESKQRMLQLVENLRVALGERIKALAWMSDETKKQALEKLSTFYVKIGYPDTWKDYDALKIDENLSFYENLRRADEFDTADHVKRRANKPVDRTEWLMTPQTINAYYNPTTNEICFPAGILQPPFFDPDADDAVNYGAIGVVIGHEMTHGFDDQGSQFDKDGNLRNWWTETDKKNFQERTGVMERFFNKIEVLPGMFANGKLTLGENIADNGGLNVAYQALQNSMKNNPLDKKYGFTPEQRFFLSYGLVWAGSIRDEQLRQFNKTDPHSPAAWRVNGALPHIDAWYKAFGIKKGDKLFVPKAKRVDVW